MNGSGQKHVLVVMGSQSDWPSTMRHTCEMLDKLDISYEKRIVSAHRTPGRITAHIGSAEENGFKVIIAGAGGAAHLPGMCAAYTRLPVIGVPVKSDALSGVDSLYSIVQMPGGVPVATMAIGKSGAINAALFAARILALSDPVIAIAHAKCVADQSATVAEFPVDDPVAGVK